MKQAPVNLKQVLTCLALLSILLQVQTVFACEMMEHSGTLEQNEMMEHCCCDDERSEQLASGGMTSCCEFSYEVTAEVFDDNSHEVVAINAFPGLDFTEFISSAPTQTFQLVDVLAVAVAPHAILIAPPVSGSDTFLITRRLRI